jgi:hypothetical protein
MEDARYSAVRSLLEVLKQKGHIQREADGLK